MSRSNPIIQPLLVTVVSDIVCPFCFIGLRNLRKASELCGIPIIWEWEPYMLNSDNGSGTSLIPEEGIPIQTYLGKKFGTKAVENMLKKSSPIMQSGREVGIEFNNDRRIYPTMKAHILVDYVKEQSHNPSAGGSEVHHKLMEDLFHHYFECGENINDPTTLIKITTESTGGVVVPDISIFSDEERINKVLRKNFDYKNGAMRINGVPFFIIKSGNSVRPLGFSGAQPPHVMAKYLEEAVADETD